MVIEPDLGNVYFDLAAQGEKARQTKYRREHEQSEQHVQRDCRQTPAQGNNGHPRSQQD